MKIAIDTNRYTDLRRGDPDVKRTLERANVLFVPLIVLAELRAGFAGGSRAAQNEAELQRFLSRPAVSVLCPDEQTASIYADVYQQLRRQGTPIPSNDIWIAALVLQHNLVLFARDAHFDHLPQIQRV